MDLTQKKCKPCEGGTLPLSAQGAEPLLREAAGWQILEDKKIKKEFRFKNFAEAMAFVNKIAVLAESEAHHPMMFINYNKVAVTLTTHAIGGLSENDFIMAAKINAL